MRFPFFLSALQKYPQKNCVKKVELKFYSLTLFLTPKILIPMGFFSFGIKAKGVKFRELKILLLNFIFNSENFTPNGSFFNLEVKAKGVKSGVKILLHYIFFFIDFRAKFSLFFRVNF